MQTAKTSACREYELLDSAAFRKTTHGMSYVDELAIT
jgi:hypothetical protein